MLISYSDRLTPQITAWNRCVFRSSISVLIIALETALCLIKSGFCFSNLYTMSRTVLYISIIGLKILMLWYQYNIAHNRETLLSTGLADIIKGLQIFSIADSDKICSEFRFNFYFIFMLLWLSRQSALRAFPETCFDELINNWRLSLQICLIGREEPDELWCILCHSNHKRVSPSFFWFN
jgi:hypothetical protein